jgi:hypothetical protein
MARVLTPESEERPSLQIAAPCLFLGGTIDNGNSRDWQSEVIEYFRDSDIVIFNPRRENWDSSANSDALEKQIDWELQALEIADAIFINLERDSQSPISLLEFGLYAGRASSGKANKLIVACPEEFWRYTNVLVTAERYKVLMVHSVSSMISDGIDLLRSRHESRMTYQGPIWKPGMGTIR